MSDIDNGRKDSPQGQAENQGMKRFDSLLDELRAVLEETPHADASTFEYERRASAHG